MSREELKFRPDVPEKIRQAQLTILEHAQKRINQGEVGGAISHDAEYFLVEISLKGGKKITEYIPKNVGDILLDNKALKTATLEEVVEAIQRFYPELEKPDLKEAVRMLRDYEGSKLKKISVQKNRNPRAKSAGYSDDTSEYPPPV